MLLALVALAFVVGIPALAIAAMVHASAARREIAALSARMSLLDQALQAALRAPGPSTGTADVIDPAADPGVAAGQSPGPWGVRPAEETATDMPAAGAGTPPPLPPFAPPQTPSIPPAEIARPGIEETIGARWAVWLGGLTLALGALFLVRFSIEAGYLGPAARVLAGLAFSAALIAAGEWLRRREPRTLAGSRPFAVPHVPGILTAAGTIGLFGAVYAAHGLYGFIGPAVAFVALAIVGVGTMLASALHGPALAGLGLVGALAAPLFVTAESANPWPVVGLVLAVTAAAYGLARLRRWRWLAVSAVAGAVAWALLLVADDPRSGAAQAHVLLQTVLAAAALALSVPRAARPTLDAVATGALLTLGLTAVVVMALGAAGFDAALFARAVGSTLILTAIVAPQAAPAAVLGALLLGLGVLAFELRPDLLSDPGGLVPMLIARPTAVWNFQLAAAVIGAVSLAIPAARLLRGRALLSPQAGFLATAAVLGPLAVLAATYLRMTQLDESLPFALIALVLALAFTGLTLRLDRGGDTPRAGLVATEIMAAGAIAALALGLTMALSKGWLTVTLALTAFGTAYVTTRRPYALLRIVIGVIGLIVLARLAWDPTISGTGSVGQWPIVNWLLWGYGVPALAFAGAWYVIDRVRPGDWVARLSASLAILFAVLLGLFQVRHLVLGDPFAPDLGPLDAGLSVTLGLLVMLGLASLDRLRADPVFRIGGLILGSATATVGGAVLLVLANPYFSGRPLPPAMGPLSALLPAFGAPAAVAAFVAWRLDTDRPRWFVTMLRVLAMLAAFTAVSLMIREAFQGQRIGFWRRTGQGELYAISLGWLLLGVVFLLIGLWRRSITARIGSAVLVMATVAKIFLIDLAGLEGLLRALSFIGLGLALIGIGLLYQKLLFTGRAQPGESASRPAVPPLNRPS